MRIAVTGRDGQVARALCEAGAARDVTIVPVGRPALDLLRPDTILPALRGAAPDVVVHAAAHTAVDAAEADPALAMAVNADGAGAVAATAAMLGCPIIHLSTDYVYDGEGPWPYREDAPCRPLNVYGHSKLAGEARVRAANPRHVILRTAWVFSPFGSNFVKTMLRLAATRDEVGVVADQRGSPTAADEIADAILAIAPRMVGARTDCFGIFHLAGQGDAVWADVAEAVFARSATLGGPVARVRRITTADYPTPACRPPDTRLSTAKLADVFGIVPPPWRVSLDRCVTRLLAAPTTAG